jgi:hypothetical protein
LGGFQSFAVTRRCRLCADTVEKVALGKFAASLSNNDSRRSTLLNKYCRPHYQSGHYISTEKRWPTFSTISPRAAIPPPTIKPPGSTLSGRKGLTAYDPLRALLAPLLNRPEAGLGDIPESKHHSARVGMFGLCGVGTNDTQRQTATSCEVAIFGTRVGACRWIIAH